jgi:acylphosphatase
LKLGKKMDKEDKIKKLEITVSGRVQGIGFRYFTLQKAIAYGIMGYVRNTYDGKVEVVAIAENTAMENFVIELRNGPRMSVVENMEIVEMATVGNYENFRIKH